MRFVILGAGAIGGTLGARLHQRGEDVILVARGPHLAALRERGLEFVSPEGRARLRIPVVGRPAELEPRQGDAVLVCTKSQHSAGALDDLRAALGPDAAVVCCQNGVANERMALRRFPRVYGMAVILPALHLEPGVVVTHAVGVGGILDVGRYPGGTDARAEALAEALGAAGFSACAVPDVMRWKYAKLLLNLGNALQAATAMDEGAAQIARRMREEALACYAAAGIDCAGVDEVRARRGAGMRLGEIPGIPRPGGSSWQSVARGTGDIESDYLNGEIVLLGRLHGVPTPVNEAVGGLGLRMARERRPPGSVPLAAVRQAIERSGGAVG